MIVRCALCDEWCSIVEKINDFRTAMTYLRVKCHGETDVIEVTHEMLKGFRSFVPVAFSTQADERDRLEVEDIALKAAGVLDPEEERLAVEDEALAAVWQEGDAHAA